MRSWFEDLDWFKDLVDFVLDLLFNFGFGGFFRCMVEIKDGALLKRPITSS